MLTCIGRLCFAGLFVCWIFGAGCQDRPAGEEAQRDADAQSSTPTLIGEWRWVASERGSQIIQPTTPFDSVTFEVGPLGLYREYGGGTVLSGRYSIAQGRMYQAQDSVFTVLMLDSSRFFARSSEQGPAVAVRSIQGDSLFLSGTGSDSTFHTFVRVEHTP